MHINILAVLAATLVPIVMGFIWYNPKTLGGAWMREAGVTREMMQGKSMALVFVLSFVFSFMLAFAMQMIVIHQVHFASMLMHHQQELKDTTQGLGATYKDIMDKYGNEFRTFKHGALHGFMASVFVILPVIAINAMFERKSWKYIWISWGYWAISFLVMGGIISCWP